MVIYDCNICMFSTTLISNYKRHINTKKHDNKIIELNEKEEIMVKNTKEHKKNTKEHKRTQKNTEKKRAFCNHCCKEFNSYASKRRHELHYCNDTLNTNSETIKQLKKEKKQLYKQIEKLIDKVGDTTINNNQTNNIQLNSYGKEDLSHISETLMNKLLKAPYGMIPKLIEEVHFNNNKPENKNIALTNKKENIIKVFSGGKWIYKNKDETINDLVDGKYFILDTHYENNPLNILKYEKFRKIYDEGDKLMIESLKKQCELVLLNNR
jgi:hypothetical protein